MFFGRGFRCLKRKLCLKNQKESYERPPETPDQKKEESHHHQSHHLPPLRVRKGFVPIIIGEFDGNQEGKKYMVRVEYLSTSTFKTMIDKLREKQHIHELDLEDDDNMDGPMKLPC